MNLPNATGGNGSTDLSPRYTTLVGNIAANLRCLRERIDAVARAGGRNPEEIRLLAATKFMPVALIQEAVQAGQTIFGENRVQEAEEKIASLRGNGLEWHFIGPLQSNKTRRAVELFDVIQTIDRPKIAERVNRQAEEMGKRPAVFIEVNIGEEPQKSGVLPQDVADLVELVERLPQLELEGLMTIPPYQDDPEASRPYFRRMFQVLSEINRRREKPLRQLSMGMTHDYAVAIEEGATLVRVGTAIFGNRPKRP